jgi:hypothetical protein
MVDDRYRTWFEGCGINTTTDAQDDFFWAHARRRASLRLRTIWGDWRKHDVARLTNITSLNVPNSPALRLPVPQHASGGYSKAPGGTSIAGSRQDRAGQRNRRALAYKG